MPRTGVLYRIQPKLGQGLISLHMNMRRFRILITVKEKSKRTDA